MLKRRGSSNPVISWIVRAVLAGALVGVFLLPPFSASNKQTDTASIKTFDSSMVLDRNGNLSSDERLAVQMPAGKHGIYRIFDIADPRRSDVEHPVTVDSVSRDGTFEPYVQVSSASGTKSIRIGDANVTLTPGVHDYQIVSSTKNVFEPGSDGQTLWWWDVVGSGWQMSMDSVDISIQLPAKPLKVECVQAKATRCDASVEGTSLRLKTGPLPPFTPVTLRVAFPSSEVATPIPAGSSNTVLFVVLSILGGLAAGAAAYVLVSRTREEQPGFPVLFEPPANVYPALGVKVLDEVDSDDDLQATLFDLAERGVLALAGNDDTWSITVVSDPATDNLPAAESAVLGALGLSFVGATFHVSPTKGAGQAISEAKKALRSHVSVDSREFLGSSPVGMAAAGLGWLCLIASVVQIFIYFTSVRGAVFWPLLVTTSVFALVALGVMFDRGVLTKRTEVGRDTWSRTGGFARFLTTD
ncbi:MAG TPA: DUF2207 domain-containing protein [Microthrixaceae bacterium]|nr:DUF2207 domain-containing protein [Microthrixaceae bacterium]